MAGIEVDGLDVAGLCGPLSLRVLTGQVRAIVVPRRRIARAIADTVAGLTPSDQVTVTGRVRLVPSDGALLPHLSVLENILAAGRLSAEPELRAKAAGYGLDGLLDRYPHEIPVGRRRLTGLARALQARPDVLVLEDEPGMPSWGALLATAWRGFQVRPDGSGRDGPRVPDLLAGVASLLIVPTAGRATAFDAHPMEVPCSDEAEGGHLDGAA